MTRQLLLGNEAIARGAWEAGVRVVSSYPGTPFDRNHRSRLLLPGDLHGMGGQ